jgi:hypothetical protein
MLVVVLAAASVYAITSFQTGVNIAVHEPVSWTPLTTNVDAFAGESKSYTVRICNAAAFMVKVKFTAGVSVTPTGGVSSDITLNATVNGVTLPVTPPAPPITIPLAPGPGVYDGSQPPVCLNVQVNFAVSQAAQPGTYAITNTVTKV